MSQPNSKKPKKICPILKKPNKISKKSKIKITEIKENSKTKNPEILENSMCSDEDIFGLKIPIPPNGASKEEINAYYQKVGFDSFEA